MQNLKVTLFLQGREEEGFNICNNPDDGICDKLTPVLLKKVWDYCLNYGDQKEAILGFRTDGDRDAMLITLCISDNFFFFIVKKCSTLNQSENFFQYILSNQTCVRWDKKISIEYIEKKIHLIEEFIKRKKEIPVDLSRSN